MSIPKPIPATADYQIYEEPAHKHRGRFYEAGLYVYHNNSDIPANEIPLADLETARVYAQREQINYEARVAQRKARQAEEAARKARLAAARKKGPLATPRQIEFIMDLIDQGRREEGGFYYGPTKREDVELMTKADASAYITSLLGDY